MSWWKVRFSLGLAWGVVVAVDVGFVVVGLDFVSVGLFLPTWGVVVIAGLGCGCGFRFFPFFSCFGLHCLENKKMEENCWFGGKIVEVSAIGGSFVGVSLQHKQQISIRNKSQSRNLTTILTIAHTIFIHRQQIFKSRTNFHTHKKRMIIRE